jgi:hypothetical protein
MTHNSLHYKCILFQSIELQTNHLFRYTVFFINFAFIENE